METAWKFASIFGGLALSTFIAYTESSPEAWFGTPLFVTSIVAAILFFVIGIVYLVLLSKHRLRPLDILDEIKCTYWTEGKQIGVSSWFRDYSNSSISTFSCVAQFGKQTVQVDDKRNVDGSFIALSNASYGKRRSVMVEFFKYKIEVDKPSKAIITIGIKPDGIWATRKKTKKVSVQIVSH